MSCAADVSGYGDSGSYGALAVVQGALAVSALFFPHQSAEFLFGPGGRRSIDAHTPVFGPGGRPSIDAYTQLFRLIGVSLLSAALKSQILQVCSSPNVWRNCWVNGVSDREVASCNATRILHLRIGAFAGTP